jgi:hypothetical protein
MDLPPLHESFRVQRLRSIPRSPIVADTHSTKVDSERLLHSAAQRGRQRSPFSGFG